MKAPRRNVDIAIIGLSCRFPGAATAEEFWNNLCDGVESITFFSDQELVQAGVDPAAFEHLSFERFSLQPMDGPDRDAATRAAIAYCLAHPRWRLSLQTHKYLGIP